MSDPPAAIQPVGLLDLGTITRMVYDNMTGVDQQFTELASQPVGRYAGYLFFPLYLLLGGTGYKAVRDGRIAGCAYLHRRQMSGFVFNVSVNRPYRRRGIGHLLMTHLEAETRRHGRAWIALQVDKDNAPAQSLYHDLGYRPYHPAFVRRDERSAIPHPAAPGVEIEGLGRQGQRCFALYAAQEREVGDSWADRVVGADYPAQPPAGGRYWRCLLNGEEIGCAWLGQPDGFPVVMLMLKPAYWGHIVTPGLISLLAGRASGFATVLDLHLGSSGHLAATASLLWPLGFRPRSRPRILMMKLLT